MSFRTAYGYTHSENDWRMVNRDGCVVSLPALGIPYTDTAPIRSGHAATVLGAWVIWYHRNVEPISSPVWGWSRDNDVETSNHLSGTAVDINAPKYPWGARTMSPALKSRVREGLRLFEGAIYWGADWGRADEMHYQVGFPEGDPRIARFAEKLDNGYLGLYGPEDAPLSAAEVKQIQDFVAGFVGPIGSDVKDIREQLAGNGARDAGEYTGWPQLGGRTVVDALAEVLKRVGALEDGVRGSNR